MRRWWRRAQWPLVLSGALIALGLGFWGFTEYFQILGEPRSHWDVFYLTVQLFTLESGSIWGPVPWQLQVARLLAPFVAGSAAIGALAVLFREQFDRFRARFFRRHTVICALGRKGWLLTESLRKRGDPVVIIEEDAENDLIDGARAHGAVVLVGDARDPLVLEKAGVHRANHLVAVSGDDGVNAEVAVAARALMPGRRNTPLTCLAHIVDPQLCTLLRVREISRKGSDPLRLEFFNVFESGARSLLNDHPVARRFSDEGPPPGRIAVIGLGLFGESLVLQAARQWQGEQPDPEKKIRITVVDREAFSLTAAMSARHPWLDRASELDPVELDLEAAAFADVDFLSDDMGRTDTSAVYLCLDDDSKGISVALSLYRHIHGKGIPIIVRMVHGAGLASLFDEEASKDGEFAGLHAFGLLDRMCNPELLFAGDHEVLARAIHEQYVRDQIEKGEDPRANPSLAPWEDLVEDLKESNRSQAGHIGKKLDAVGCDLSPLVDWYADGFTFRPEELEKLARMEHERFVRERTEAGWRPGPKDPNKKRSPHLIPWTELDPEIKDLDRLFIENLPTFLAQAGFQIVRVEGANRTEARS